MIRYVRVSHLHDELLFAYLTVVDIKLGCSCRAVLEKSWNLGFGPPCPMFKPVTRSQADFLGG